MFRSNDIMGASCLAHNDGLCVSLLFQQIFPLSLLIFSLVRGPLSTQDTGLEQLALEYTKRSVRNSNTGSFRKCTLKTEGHRGVMLEDYFQLVPSKRNNLGKRYNEAKWDRT